jgi:hypothetical protein
MSVELKPRIEALLRAQVAAGHYASLEDAITAAVLGVPISEEGIGDLSWARPYLEEADASISAIGTLSEEETFAELERRFGKL